MGTTQVTSFHPVLVGASSQQPQVIKNVSGATLYGAQNPGVSSTVKDWEITEGSSETIYGNTWVVTKEKTDTEIRVSAGENPPIGLALPVNLPGRREIESVNAVIEAGETVGVYATIQTEPKFTKATALKFTSGVNPLNVFYFDPKVYEIAGRVTNLTLEQLIMTDNVAPEASFIAGLYKIEKVEGAEKKHEVTVEPVVTGSTVQITTPAAKTATQKAVTFNAANMAAGFYLLGVETITATTALKSFEAITLTVFANV